jgi:purine-nucleoside phosphorylase
MQESLKAIRAITNANPPLGLVLGSGLGDFADSLNIRYTIDTRAIPGYPVSTVEGHRGRLVFAEHSGVELLAFQGRVHFYESDSVEKVCFPMNVASLLGVKIVIVTNAAGGIKAGLNPGDLMAIEDQINLTGESSISKNNQPGKLNSFYDRDLLVLLKQVARDKGVRLKSGVYGGVKGPSYETAAEVEMVRRLGGDAVGMSTVLETSYARQLGMKVLGISCITNKATGISLAKLDHAEVTEAAALAKAAFSRLLLGVIAEFSVRFPGYVREG